MDAGSRVALTTHYTQLKELAASDERFGVSAMQFVDGRPTYRLIKGAVGESFALQARRSATLRALSYLTSFAAAAAFCFFFCAIERVGGWC